MSALLSCQRTYEDPKMDKIYRVGGDIIYGIGIGVVANVAYTYSQSQYSSPFSIFLGFYLVIIGSLLKDY